MDVTAADLEAIARTVWESVVGLPYEKTVEYPSLGNGDFVLGTIAIGGDRNYTLWVSSTSVGARKVTAHMFRIQADAVTFDDVRDAFGELVNVMYGNVKRLVQGECLLSLPQVREVGLGECRSTSSLFIVNFFSGGDEYRVQLCGDAA